jgi:protein-S-isoprenylcysteine O-methyltransferase Ste14
MSPKLLSLIAFSVAVAALVVLVLEKSLLAREPIAIGVQVAAVLFFLWARLTMGWRSFHATANPLESARLVTTGPYGLVRHPIYVALWAFAWAGVADHLSVLTAAMGLVIAAGLFVRMLLEEGLLRERFPEYADYARRTKRIVPFVL